MATAISRRVSRKRTIEVRIATVGIIGRRTKAAVAISWIRRWPAVRLAVSRTPRARGRIKKANCFDNDKYWDQWNGGSFRQ